MTFTHPGFVVLSGNWSYDLEMMYHIFSDDFIHNNVYFRGKQVRIKYYPPRDGKALAFWHLIQEDETPGVNLGEDKRVPDFDRCRRLNWIAQVISLADECDNVYVWSEPKKDIVIWYEEERYLVILEERRRYYLLRTAYYVNPSKYPHKLKSLYKRKMKTGATISSGP